MFLCYRKWLHVMTVLLLVQRSPTTSATVNIHVTIDQHATDTDSCILNGSCHTLGYVLSLINKTANTPHSNYMINVLYDQILSSGEYKIHASEHLSITSPGNISLHGPIHEPITFIGRNSSNTVSIANIQWNECRFNFSNLNRINFSNVEFYSCLNILVETVKTFGMYNSLVTNSNPGNEDLINIIPTNVFDIYIDNTVVFDNYMLNGSEHNAIISLKITDENKLSIHFKLNNCRFSNNNNVSSLLLQIKNSTLQHSNIEINDCSFDGNTKPIFMNIEDSQLYYSFVVIVYSKFTHNSVQFGVSEGIIDLQALGSRNGSFMVANNVFENNNGTNIVIVTNMCDGMIFDIHNLTFFNNSGFQVTAMEIASLLQGGSMEFKLVNITAASNYILPSSTLHPPTVLNIQVSNNMCIENIYLTNNIGTGITLIDSSVQLNGEIFLTNNRGVYGGGLNLVNSGTNNVSADVRLINNYAINGGGVAINSENECNILRGNCSGSILFENNTATSSGSNLYAFQSKCIDTINESFKNCNIIGLENSTISTAATQLSLNNSHTVFPGQNIVVHPVVLDYFQNPTYCTAIMYLKCDNNLFICDSHDDNNDDDTNAVLKGMTNAVLSNSRTTLGITVSSPKEGEEHYSTLVFECLFSETNVVAELQLNIIPCPFGFSYNTTTRMCECPNIGMENENKLMCSLSEGILCIEEGYWIGFQNDNVVAITTCKFPFCTMNPTPCPLDTNNKHFIMLGETQDDQCSINHGGWLCVNCKADATYTFESEYCVEKTKCREWQPYVIILLAVTLQMFLTFLIIVAVQMKVSVGCAYLYGPLFFIAVTEHLPFNYILAFTPLQKVLTIFSSFVFLNLRVIGCIEWCFAEIDPFINYLFRYLGPSIVIIGVLVTVLMARKWPKVLSTIQSNPIYSICLLSLLLFWSVIDTSVSILLPFSYKDINGTTHWVSSLQPDKPYLSPLHAVIATIAFISILVVVFPFIFLLFFSQCLRRKVLLINKMQPVLDELQSGFKDRYRWYSGVYFLSWVIIVAMRQFIIGREIVLMILLIMHFVIQPYKSHWLNVVDALLLLDISFIIDALHWESSELVKANYMVFVIVSIYILTLIPLCYMIIGAIVIVANRLRLNKRTVMKFTAPVFTRSEVRCQNENELDISGIQENSFMKFNSEENINVTEVDDVFRYPRERTLNMNEDREPLIKILADMEDVKEYGTGHQ